MSEEEATWSTRMARLEAIIEQLEQAEIDLATTLELFEEGLELQKACEAELKAAEGRLRELAGDDQDEG
tara:strand:- start:711 stop:917 length:207 start_codon:yes stop_codon:yes gene_type:complete